MAHLQKGTRGKEYTIEHKRDAEGRHINGTRTERHISQKRRSRTGTQARKTRNQLRKEQNAKDTCTEGKAVRRESELEFKKR